MKIEFQVAPVKQSLFTLISLLEDKKNDDKANTIANAMKFSLEEFYKLETSKEKLNFLGNYYENKMNSQKNLHVFHQELNEYVENNIDEIEAKFTSIFGESAKNQEFIGLF